MKSLVSKLVILSAVVVAGVSMLATPAAAAAAAKPTGETPLRTCYREKPVLRSAGVNRHHYCVLEVQKLLATPFAGDPNGRGYDPGPLDGVYGPKTKAAVKRFQDDCNRTMRDNACKDRLLVVDGIVGKYTWKALKLAYGTND